MPASSIQALYYITHLDNLPSIFERGVLSHAEMEKSGLRPPARIYNEEVIALRQPRKVDGKSLWDYANFYFNPRNPMLYQVCQQKHDVVVLKIRRDLLDAPGAQIAVGNAARNVSEIFPADKGVKKVTSKNVWERVKAEWWNDSDETKRLTMSELLVPKSAGVEWIDSVYVPDKKTLETVNQMNRPGGIAVIFEPQMFFRPNYFKRIYPNISLFEGDMFFSQMQTLTISVNTRRVMGKGLASRTKHQFPDVYVKYQDACDNKQLAIGKPFLYRRERSFDHDLADMPKAMPHPNAIRWFLLFATKDDWKYPSRMEYIEKGMLWLEKNYKKEKITSIALPALGCGLGGLEWGAVGPLMCGVLSRLDIKSAIYLPRENVIPDDQKTAAFLLEKSSGIR